MNKKKRKGKYYFNDAPRLKPKSIEDGRHNASRILIIFLLIAMICLITAVLISLLWQPSQEQREQQQSQQQTKYYYPQFVSLKNASYVTMFLPAVDENGNGIATTLIVEGAKGSGRTLVDIENLVFWDDTQTSIRIAKVVAADITNIDVRNYDLVYTIYANASVVGGPSAGAALALATIAILQNKTLNNDIMITGAVDLDGTIGQVSGIIAKAKAAKQLNATLFLVPMGQSTEIVYEIKKDCKKVGDTEFCTIKQVPKILNVGEAADIQVREVVNIQEAMKYFF